MGRSLPCTVWKGGAREDDLPNGNNSKTQKQSSTMHSVRSKPQESKLQNFFHLAQSNICVPDLLALGNAAAFHTADHSLCRTFCPWLPECHSLLPYWLTLLSVLCRISLFFPISKVWSAPALSLIPLLYLRAFLKPLYPVPWLQMPCDWHPDFTFLTFYHPWVLDS